MYTVTVKLMTDEMVEAIEAWGDTYNGTHINSVTTLETTIIYQFNRYGNAADFIRSTIPYALKVEIKMNKHG